MRKYLSVAFMVACISLQAQFVNQVTLLDSFSVSQIDSIIVSQGVPSGVIQLKYPVKTYKVLYNTVSWDSSSTVASGLLCVPVGLPCKTALVSYQHGTTTQRNQVASYEQGGEWFISLIAAAVGFVSIQPDYLGLGYNTLPLHPYQHAHTEATSVIDLIRATRDTVAALGAPVDDQLFLIGYSQGGHATMAAHQLIQQQLDSTMHVTASAPGSGAYDMGGVMADLLTSGQPYPAPYYLPYLVLAYNEVYNIFPADSDFFIHPYDTVLPPLFYAPGGADGNTVDNDMPNVPVQIMQPVLVDSFISDSNNNNDVFRNLLRENDTYNWIPTSPIHMYGCDGDQYVPFENAKVAYAHFIQNGTPPGLIDTDDVSPSSNHVACAQFAILAGTTWFQTLVYQPLASLGVTAVNDSSSTDSTNSTGSATAMDTLGNAPYSYLWSNGDTTATVTGLSAGTYYVTVTDKSLCTVTDSTVISYVHIATGVESQVLTNVRIFPNPTNGFINIQNLDPSDNIKTTEVYDMSGRLVKTYSLRQSNSIKLYFEDDAQGVYYVYMRSEAGKEVRQKVVVME